MENKENKTIPSLPQYKGKNNPYDELWALSLEIGRELLMKAIKMHEDEIDINKHMTDYNNILGGIERLNENEREFLLNDSYFAKNNTALWKLTCLEKEAHSSEDYTSKLVSKDFLIATLGKEDGIKEYNRRCDLSVISWRYTESFLEKCLEYVSTENPEKNESIEKFIDDNFCGYVSIEDLQFMLELKKIGYDMYKDKLDNQKK